jgi:hypothetical protein
MPIIKKFAPRENLETFSTFITTNNDTDAGSVYFRISELNPTLTGGKNGFLIEGSPHLKETTEIKIEILDVNGNTVYFEPGKGIPDYYEGLSKVVSVHIYPDTPIGVGKMTVMGELKTYIDDDGVERGIPDEWKGIYNVKWETDLKINRNLPNEDKVRFYRRPTIEIDEIVKPVFNTQIPTVIQTGVVSGFSIIPESQTLLDNFTDPTFYRLTISGSETWTGSVIGSDIVVDTTPPYIATVLDVVNTKDITVSPPYSIDGRVAELPNTSYTVQFLNRDGRENTDSPLSGSFAKITIKDLKTFVGDVVRVKVFRRSESSIGDFEFTQEIELESNELLIDFDAVGKVQEKFGLLTEPIIEEYWDSSSLSTTFNQDVLFNSVNFTPDGVGQFFTKNEVQFNNDVEYTVSFGVRLSGSFDNGDYLKVFTSGSNENQLFLNLTASDILKEKRTVSQNIIAERDENVRLVFEIVGNGWFVNNISLRASQETAFSPDEITFIQSVPRLLQSEIFEYKFEFYDINNNLIPVKIGKTKEFTGGNTTLITRGLEVIPSNQFFTYDAEGNSTGLAQILFDIRRNLLTGSVSFVSSAFAPNGDLIDESDYSSGQYPGLLINQTDSSAVLTSANFTGSRDDIDVQYIVYEASCEDQIATVLIAKIEDGRSGLGAGFIESTAVSFVRKDDKTFTPPSASITAFFRDREDFQTPITASIIAYPSYSFDGGIDRNFIWYESDTVNPSINVEVFDSTSSIITEGEVNASQTDTAVVRFTFTDSIGDVISTQQSLSITSDGDKGDDTVRIDLTPSNFVFSKNEQGIVQNFNEGTTLVRVLQGNNALKYDQELSEAGTWATQSINPNNISIGSIDDIDESTLQISGLSSLQSNLGTIEYNLIARPEYVNQFNTASVEIETTQAFTSIRDGSNSRLVRLFSSAYDVVYDADYPQSGVSPINPIGAITLTAFQFNHTGSVFYEFYNNGILEFGPSTTNQLVIPSGEMPQPEEISVWEVRTRENTSVSVEVARDSLDIVGRKNGRDARDISISFTPSFFKFTSSFDSNPIINEVTASIVTKNIPTFTTSSISFRSGSTTDFVSWDDFFLGKSNIPTLDQTNNIYNFVIKYDDHIGSRENLPLTVRAQQTVFGQTIRDIETIESIIDGDPAAPLYVFDTPSGSIIRNKTGSLVLGILESSVDGITPITSGDIQLFSGSVVLSASLNGVSDTDGIDARYRATITEEFITGNTVITIKDNVTNTEYASISIFDVTDGLPGGSTNAIPSILVRRDEGGAPFYEPSESIVTGKFFGLPDTENGDLVIYSGSIKLVPFFSASQNLDYVYWENINTGSLTVEVDDKDGIAFDEGIGNAVATKDVEVIFRFTDRDDRIYEAPKTVVIQSDGVDGRDFIQVINTNQLVSVDSENDGTVKSGGLDGSGTTVKVFESIDKLNYVDNLETDISLVGSNTGSWVIDSISIEPVGGITAGSISFDTVNFLSASISDHSNLTVDRAVITYNIRGWRGDLRGGLPVEFNTIAEQTIYKNKEGSGALTVEISNENHTFTADILGEVVDFNGSGTTIKIFEGGTPLIFNSINNTFPPSGQFNISTTSTGIVTGSVTGQSTNTATFENVISVDSGVDSPFIDFSISGSRVDGTEFTIDKVQSFSKSKQGEAGEPGEDAPPIYRAEIIRGSNVTVPISVFGTPNFSGSGVTIVGYKDEIALTGSLSAPTSTQYSASIFDKSTFITTGTPTIVSNEVVFGDITNWDLPTINRNGFVTYKVTFDGNIDRFVTQRLNTTSDGETGPGIVFRGGWTGSVDYKFQENNRRDAVLFDKNGDGTPEMYYATLQPSGPSTTPILPSGSVDSSDYWEELGEEDFFVAAKIAIFEESFVKNTLNVGTPAEGGSEAGIVINGRDSESTYISIGQPVIGFQQTGIFQGVSGSNNQTPYLSLQSATGSNGEYRSLEWDGSQLTIRGGIRQTAAGVVVTESINRGTWEIGSIYEIGNIVQYGEIGLPTASYSAIQSHTASFSNNPPSASFWSVFAVGKDGIDGAPGGSGSDAKTVQLTATSQVFRKANDGTIEPSSIDFTASLQNTVDTLATFTSSSNAPLTISGNTATLTTSSFGSNTRVTYTAAADSLSDSITIILVEDGSNAIQPILSNEAHVIPTDSDGNNGDFGGSGTLLQVFEGTTPLIYSSGAPGTFPLDDGRFRVEITNNGVSGGTALNVGDGTTTASLQPLTGMSNDTGSRTFTVRYRRLNSETGSLQKIQSFAKSRAGVSGSDGVDGQDGQDGLPGPGIVYRGEWAPNKFYRGTATRKDVVLASNDIHYIAQSNHISSIGFVQPWQSNESYKIGDVVLFTTSSDLSAYEAKISHNSTVSNPPETATDTNEWSFIGFTDLLASDGVMVDFQTGFSEPPNSKWEPFGATFTSIATSFILTEDAVATRSISVGENAAITIFGSGSSPYISIGQANGSQGFNQTGIFAGIVNDTGSLSLKSATDVVSWNGNDFNISGSNSSLVISGLGGETRIEGGKLTTIDGVFQGRIDACAGSVGGFNIESGFLTSCNNRILIDGANNIISINDINDSTKFIANTDVALPSTQASETGTLFLTSSTDSISSDSTTLC